MKSDEAHRSGRLRCFQRKSRGDELVQVRTHVAKCSGGDRIRCRGLEIVSRPTVGAVSAFTRWNALSLIRQLIARSFQRHNYSQSNYPSHPHSRNGHVAISIQRSSEWSALSSTHLDQALSEKVFGERAGGVAAMLTSTHANA
jgi:hypothetical protein